MTNMSKVDMHAITVLWHDAESAGYTDVLPTEWFAKLGVQRNCTHAVLGPRGRRYEARCDVTVRSKYAELNYEPHESFNKKRDMFIGIMRLTFSNRDHRLITHVEWKEQGDSSFLPCSTTIASAQIALHSIGPGDPDLLGISREEGRPELVSHLTRERRPELVREKKKAVLAKTGVLACEACGFVFTERYGSLGDDFCEVHHREQLAKRGVKRTELSDLAILCSNCHRMIHRTGHPMLSVEAFTQKHLTTRRSGRRATAL